MASNTNSPWRQLAAYLLDLDHLKNLLFVAAGGYAAGLFAWELRHRDQLANYILNNQLIAGARPSLILLALSALIACELWLLISWLIARPPRGGLGPALGTVSGLFFLAVALPFLPVLALDGIETRYPWWTFFCVAAVSLIAGTALFEAANQARDYFPPESLRRWSARLGTERAGRYAFILVVALSAGYVVFMSVLTLARHNTFQTHSFDLGIHDQVVYNILHHGVMRSTQHGPEVINYIGEHFSPILFLLAPLYAIRQEAGTLLVLQSLLLGIGAIPVYLLARLKTRSTAISLALSVTYLLYPALHGVNTFDFHQIAPVTPLLLFALYFLEARRDVPFLVFLGLALLTKEEVALTVVAIGLYLFLVRRRYRLGLALAGFGLAYFFAVVKIVMPSFGREVQVARFSGIMAPGSSGFGAIAKTLVTNPYFTLRFIFGNPDKLVFLSQLLLPVIFLPLLGGTAWLIAIPAFAVALLSSAETQYSIASQYSAIMIPFVFVLAVFGLVKLAAAQRERVLRGAVRLALAGAILTAGLLMTYEYGWIAGKDFRGLPVPTAHQQVVAAYLKEIPRAASVSAMGALVPHLSNRDTVRLFPVLAGADYLLFDTDPNATFWPFEGHTGRSDAIKELIPTVASGAYGLLKSADGVLLFKRGSATAGNRAALDTLLSAKFEAEDLRSNIAGSKQPDAGASEGWARVSLPGAGSVPQGLKLGEPVALVYGPYDTPFPGKYRVTYRLKTQPGSIPAGQKPGPIATLDVFSNAAGGSLADLEVTASDFHASGGYQDFSFDVEIRQRLEDVEYRVMYRGPDALWVDKIELAPVDVPLPPD